VRLIRSVSGRLSNVAEIDFCAARATPAIENMTTMAEAAIVEARTHVGYELLPS
jgi:hypothetical protein